MAREGVRHAQPLRFREGIDRQARKGQPVLTGGFRRQRQQRRRIRHQRLVAFARAVPFQHGEFRMVERPALAIAEDMRKGKQPGLASGQQLLAGKFR